MNNLYKETPIISGAKFLLAGLILAFTSTVFANTDIHANTDSIESVTYNYVPAEALKTNIQNSLSAQQIDVSSLEINVDDKGTVNVSGDVDSKQSADTIKKVIKEKQGVYTLYSQLIYPSM